MFASVLPCGLGVTSANSTYARIMGTRPMISAGRLRPNFVLRLSVNDAIGTSITPSMIFAITPNTAQTPAMTRSRCRNV